MLESVFLSNDIIFLLILSGFQKYYYHSRSKLFPSVVCISTFFLFPFQPICHVFFLNMILSCSKSSSSLSLTVYMHYLPESYFQGLCCTYSIFEIGIARLVWVVFVFVFFCQFCLSLIVFLWFKTYKIF